MRLLLFSCMIILIAGCNASNGGTSTAPYFPLAVGNSWVLSTPNRPLPMFVQAMTDSLRVTSTITHNGQTYYFVKGIGSILLSGSDSLALRYADNDVVYVLIGGQEYVYLNFSAQVGVTWSSQFSENLSALLYISTKTGSAQTSAGTFNSCANIGTPAVFLPPDIAGFGWTTTFERGVGPVAFNASSVDFREEYLVSYTLPATNRGSFKP